MLQAFFQRWVCFPQALIARLATRSLSSMDVMVGSKAAFNRFHMPFWAWRSKVVSMQIACCMFTVFTSPVAAGSIPSKHRCVETLSKWHDFNLVGFFWTIVLPNPRFSLPWIWNCSAGEWQTYQIYSKHKHKALVRWLYSTGSEMKQHVSCWVMLIEPYPFYATHTATLIEFIHQENFGPFCPHRRQGFPISLHHHNLAPRCMSGGSRDAPQSDPNSKRPTHRMHKDHKGVPKGKYIPCISMFNDV